MSSLKDLLTQSVYFGVLLSLAAYEVGMLVKKKLNFAVFNPLLISVAIIISVLLLVDVDYETYAKGANLLNYMLTPVTVCLAIPLYEQLDMLNKNLKAISFGLISGVITSMISILGMSIVFGLTHEEYVTLLPKSITTAIGIALSKEQGGYETITVAAIMITGILGNIIAPSVCKLFRITHPVAKGVGIGAASHAIGTTKAMEMGEIEGAMSSLSIAVTGLITVISVSIFAQVY